MTAELRLPAGTGSFGPETNLAMSIAFERVWKAIQESGLPADDSQVHEIRNTLAKRIVALAFRGERDPTRLYELALEEQALVRFN